MGILHKIADKILLHGDSGEQKAMKYALKQGFRCGKNFQYNSGYPIDANWPC